MFDVESVRDELRRRLDRGLSDRQRQLVRQVTGGNGNFDVVVDASRETVTVSVDTFYVFELSWEDLCEFSDGELAEAVMFYLLVGGAVTHCESALARLRMVGLFCGEEFGLGGEFAAGSHLVADLCALVSKIGSVCSSWRSG